MKITPAEIAHATNQFLVDVAAATIRLEERLGLRRQAVEVEAPAVAAVEPPPAPRKAKPVPAPAPLEDGVPTDLALRYHDAYREGVEARRGGQGRDLNPFVGDRGIAGGRRKAWLRGWDEGRAA